MASAKKMILAGVLGVSAIASAPTTALAHDGRGDRYASYDDGYYEGDWGRRGYRGDDYAYREYRRDDYRDRSRYRRDCRSSGTTGTIIGGALGALLGRGIDRYGERTTGTLLGAGGGALLGREIDRNRRC